MDKSKLLDSIIKAIDGAPQVKPLLSGKAQALLYAADIKAAALSRDELERKLARSISAVEKKYIAILEENNGVADQQFWRDYENDLQVAIAQPIRKQIENYYSDNQYYQVLDIAQTNTQIERAVTAAIAAIVISISKNTQTAYAELIMQGLSGSDIVERISLRFSSGHAEQIAITELTRADSTFADVLSSGLDEIGLKSQQRWLTFEDEKVCPICAPADHKLRDEPITTSKGGWNGQTWGQRFPKGSPAHPNCRCKISVEVIGWKPNE